ncbi:hypothetical protein EFN46_06100 [Leuconostoc pseudomesenteroides]|nr:hypothetical protein [Leuconostoc pseudomesenteroides]
MLIFCLCLLAMFLLWLFGHILGTLLYVLILIFGHIFNYRHLYLPVFIIACIWHHIGTQNMIVFMLSFAALGWLYSIMLIHFGKQK